MLKRGYALAAACLAAAVAVTAFTPNGKFDVSWRSECNSHPGSAPRDKNVDGILAKHCLHCILCKFQHVLCCLFRFVQPRIARVQLISRVENRITANPRLGNKMPTKDVGVPAASCKVDRGRMRHLSSVLRRRQLRQGMRKAPFLVCFKLFNCNDCIVHSYWLTRIALPSPSYHILPNP